MEKLFQRRIKWFLTNSFLAITIWYGLGEGVEGAKNVAMFITWVMFVLSFAYLSEDVQKSMLKKGRSIPSSLSTFVEIGFVLTYVWFGYFFTGLAVFLSMIFVELAWDKVNNIQKEENERKES